VIFIIGLSTIPGPRMNANGPAIWGGCVTWRNHPATGLGTLAGKLSRWQDRYGALFAVRVQILPEHYECRGTSLIGAVNLSPITKLVVSTGAVSRYNVERSK